MATVDHQGAYQFQSQPQTVPARKKYRDPYDANSEKRSGNLMHDKRVVRGNTYAAQVLPVAEAERLALEKEQAERKRMAALRRKQEREEAAKRSKTPEPVEGRQHIDIQTDQYLEELTDRIVEEDISTQTDPFMDRAPSPLFMPPKRGTDTSTQIYEGDLFDFDLEVEPILEVLVGKTLEQSMLEVMEEEEFKEMARHKKEMEQCRNAELSEVQRMEAAEKRRFDEKERRKVQEKSRVEAERRAKEKMAARRFAKDFLVDLQGTVFNGLTDAGFFYDEVEREVETTFLGWLQSRVDEKLEEIRQGRDVVDDLLKGSLKLALHRADDVRKERLRLKLEEEERLRKIEEEKLAAEEKARVEAENESRRAREQAEAVAAGSNEENEDGEEEEEES